jgi:putative membrane protein
MALKCMSRSFWFCCVLALLAGPRLMAQAAGVPAGTDSMPGVGKVSVDPNTPHSFPDQAFVRMVLERDMAEMELGKLAEDKAQGDDVKTLARWVATDASQLNGGFKALAGSMNVSLPKEASKKDKQAIAKLQGLSGTQFDEEFIKIMMNMQRRDHNDFDMEADKADDPNLKQAAAQDSAAVAAHLKDTQKIAQAHNIPLNAKG